jgi:hypothetical protein
VTVEDVKESGEGQLINSGNFDGKDSGDRVHPFRQDVAGVEGDDALLGGNVVKLLDSSFILWQGKPGNTNQVERLCTVDLLIMVAFL